MASDQATLLASLSDNHNKRESMKPSPTHDYLASPDMLRTHHETAEAPLAPKSTGKLELSTAHKSPRSPIAYAGDEEIAHCTYRDCSRDPIEDLSDPTAFLNAASSAKDSPFPVKLHRILCNPDYQDIIAWLPHGRSWRVLKPKAFEEKVIPAYFRHCRYSSFMRQVNGWGFKRIYQGADLNSYYHELFLQGLPHLSLKMRRPSNKQSRQNAHDAAKAPAPDFYALSEKNPLPCYPSGFRVSSEGNEAKEKSPSLSSHDSTAKKNSTDQSGEKRALPQEQSEDRNFPEPPQVTSDSALTTQATNAETIIKARALKLRSQHKEPQQAVTDAFTHPTHDALAAVLRQQQLQNAILQIQLQGQPSFHTLEAQQQLLNLLNAMRPVTSENEVANFERIQQTLPVPKLQNLLLGNARAAPVQQALNVNAEQLQLQHLLAANGGFAAPSVISSQQQREEDMIKYLQLNQMQQRNMFF